MRFVRSLVGWFVRLFAAILWHATRSHYNTEHWQDVYRNSYFETRGCCLRRGAVCACQCDYDGGRKRFYDSRCPRRRVIGCGPVNSR